MDDNRRRELEALWNEEQDEAWRDLLDTEELNFVATLDEIYAKGVRRICSGILIQEKLRTIFGRNELSELRQIGDHWRIHLRSGNAYDVRLNCRGDLQFLPIDAAC